MTLHTGRKIELVFDVLVIFSTNLPPKDLVDEAFLRRLRHKIEITDPSFEEYREIFKRVTQQKGVEYNEQVLAYLLQEWYVKRNRKLRASHPRDLCDQILDIAHYHAVDPEMTKELIDQAAEILFRRIMSAGFPFHKPLVLGHRGDYSHAPENTLSAFHLALESGADGFELDARLTSDDVVMVLHDATVDRVSNGKGRLAQLTREAVAGLDSGIGFHPRFAGEQIPTLQRVFETFGTTPVYDLEIKNFDAPNNGLEHRVLELVHQFRLEQRVMVTSFNPLAVRFFRQHLPQAPAGLLLLGGRLGKLEEVLLSNWVSSESGRVSLR